MKNAINEREGQNDKSPMERGRYPRMSISRERISVPSFSGLCRFHAYDDTSTTVLHFLDIHGAATGDRIHKNIV